MTMLDDRFDTATTAQPTRAAEVVSGTRESNGGSWLRRLWLGARRWLILPIVVGLMGAVGGITAGVLAKPTAETLLRVQTDAGDGSGMEVQVESAVFALNTTDVFASAARRVGSTVPDLQARTRIAPVPESQIISITVTSSSPSRAVDEADALAEAGIAANQERVETELASVTDQTRQLIQQRKLSNDSAERARVQRLGDSLGASQSSLVVGASEVTLLQGGRSSRLLPSPLLLGAMGLLGGALLGLGGALLLGTRRGVLQSAQELRELYPQASVIEPAELPTMVNVEALTASTIFVGGLDNGPGQLRESVDGLVAEIQALGLRPSVVDGLPGSAPHRERSDAVNVQPLALNGLLLRRIGQIPLSVLVVVVEPKVTRLATLQDLAPQFPERTYLLVSSRAPQWH